MHLYHAACTTIGLAFSVLALVGLPWSPMLWAEGDSGPDGATLGYGSEFMFINREDSGNWQVTKLSCDDESTSFTGFGGTFTVESENAQNCNSVRILIGLGLVLSFWVLVMYTVNPEAAPTTRMVKVRSYLQLVLVAHYISIISIHATVTPDDFCNANGITNCKVKAVPHLLLSVAIFFYLFDVALIHFERLRQIFSYKEDLDTKRYQGL